MAHLRKRYLENILASVTRFSPLIGILGHRQVGKTTLLEHISKKYYTLDEASEIQVARETPKKFLQKRQGHLVAIDECQLAPELFPALKEHVRVKKQPGQFLLSGSVRFTSRKAIRESLTGRIVNLELYPLTIQEIYHQPLSSACRKAMTVSSLEFFLREHSVLQNKAFAHWTKAMNIYLSLGGLPGICFVHDEKLRDLRLREQIHTILDRDLRLVQKTSLPISQIIQLCARLVQTQGEPLDYTDLQKNTGISTPTLKKLLFALEAIFLIRLIPIEGGRKGHIIFFEDIAEANWFRTLRVDKSVLLSHLCFTQVRAQFGYLLGEKVEFFHFRTRGGALVPLGVRTRNGALGIIPISDTANIQKPFGSASSFIRTYENSRVLLLHPGKEFRLLHPRILLAPLVELL